MQLPATTLTMCPSCERVATNTTGAGAGAGGNNSGSQIPAALSLGKPRVLGQAHQQQAQKAHQIAS
ncbi:putative homeobox-leucine zipper protein HOX11-like [Sesbania bispinosa]|nr:putative homeobox-leucine zipper protein HOX11-like [Sesbania bispinosa]